MTTGNANEKATRVGKRNSMLKIRERENLKSSLGRQARAARFLTPPIAVGVRTAGAKRFPKAVNHLDRITLAGRIVWRSGAMREREAEASLNGIFFSSKLDDDDDDGAHET